MSVGMKAGTGAGAGAGRGELVEITHVQKKPYGNSTLCMLIKNNFKKGFE